MPLLATVSPTSTAIAPVQTSGSTRAPAPAAGIFPGSAGHGRDWGGLHSCQVYEYARSATTDQSMCSVDEGRPGRRPRADAPAARRGERWLHDRTAQRTSPAATGSTQSTPPSPSAPGTSSASARYAPRSTCGTGASRSPRRRKPPPCRPASRRPASSPGNPARDAAVLSPSLLDAETYPSLSFTSTELVQAKGQEEDQAAGLWSLRGELEVRGVTRLVEVSDRTLSRPTAPRSARAPRSASTATTSASPPTAASPPAGSRSTSASSPTGRNS